MKSVGSITNCMALVRWIDTTLRFGLGPDGARVQFLLCVSDIAKPWSYKGDKAHFNASPWTLYTLYAFSGSLRVQSRG